MKSYYLSKQVINTTFIFIFSSYYWNNGILSIQKSHFMAVLAFPSCLDFMKQGASSSSLCRPGNGMFPIGTSAGPLFTRRRKNQYRDVMVSFPSTSTLNLEAASLGPSTVVLLLAVKDGDFGSVHDAVVDTEMTNISTKKMNKKKVNDDDDDDDILSKVVSKTKKRTLKTSSTTRESRQQTNNKNDHDNLVTVKGGRNSSMNKPKKKSSSTTSTSGSGGRKQTESNAEPIYFYRNVTDIVTILKNKNDNDIAKDGHVTMVKFKVRGNPVPLARHRSYRGLMFNPSAKKQRQFYSVVLDMLPDYCFKEPSSISGSSSRSSSRSSSGGGGRSIDDVIPMFQNQVISVQIICRMKRPKRHFVANKPGPGRLKEDSFIDENGVIRNLASHLQVTRSDVDNLAKFVLDSLNGILYNDDRQVASLHVMKVYDDEEPYSGSTDVTIQTMTCEDFQVAAM